MGHNIVSLWNTIQKIKIHDKETKQFNQGKSKEDLCTGSLYYMERQSPPHRVYLEEKCENPCWAHNTCWKGWQLKILVNRTIKQGLFLYFSYLLTFKEMLPCNRGRKLRII